MGYQVKLMRAAYDQGYTQKRLALELEIAESTFSYKVSGGTDFTFAEVVKLCELLGIDNPIGFFEVNPKKKKMPVLRPNAKVRKFMEENEHD